MRHLSRSMVPTRASARRVAASAGALVVAMGRPSITGSAPRRHHFFLGSEAELDHEDVEAGHALTRLAARRDGAGEVAQDHGAALGIVADRVAVLHPDSPDRGGGEREVRQEL